LPQETVDWLTQTHKYEMKHGPSLVLTSPIHPQMKNPIPADTKRIEQVLRNVTRYAAESSATNAPPIELHLAY